MAQLSDDLLEICTQELFVPSQAVEVEFDELIASQPPQDLEPVDTDSDSEIVTAAGELLEESPHESNDDCDSRFRQPTTDEEISALREGAIPLNTKKNTTWAVNVWIEWAAH